MSWLFLDTHSPGRFRLGWFDDDGRVDVREVDGRATMILPMLEKTWKSRGKKIIGVCVVAGPGSFSAVRTGVLYANLIARFSRVPLVGITVAESDDLVSLSSHLLSGSVVPSSYVAPVYDAEPNITKPRPVQSFTGTHANRV